MPIQRVIESIVYPKGCKPLDALSPPTMAFATAAALKLPWYFTIKYMLPDKEMTSESNGGLEGID